MTDPANDTDVNAYFKEHEGVISDWKSALDLINRIIEGNRKGGPRNLVWRGLTDSEFWPDNSLYRHLQKRNQNLPGNQEGRPPFEDDLLLFESELLNQARAKWRFDHLSALEILAQIRHHGGPVRLLDVTFNPLIALWFAVERQFDETGRDSADTDGRLFAFDVTDGEILLDHDWGGRDLPWSLSAITGQRQFGQQEPQWIWKPPSYNERIPAQNSAFLIGRVPSEVELRWKYFGDHQFRSKLECASKLVAQANEKLLELKQSLPEWPSRRKLTRDLEIVVSLESDFETLHAIGEEVDSLTMAILDLVEAETGAIGMPKLLWLNPDLEIIRNLKGDFKDDISGEGKRAFEELIAEGSEEECKEFDNYVVEMGDWLVDSLIEFTDAIDETEDWILNRGDLRTFSSLPMKLTKIDEVSPPEVSATYTLRITAEAKVEIREVLERSYGYSAWTLYPDIMGLAGKSANLITWPA